MLGYAFHHDPDVAPRPVPFLGHMPGLIEDPLRLFLVMSRTQGDVVRMKSAFRTMVLLSRPDHVKLVLRDAPEKFSKLTPVYRAMGTILGRGILTSEGDHWLVHRRIVQPAFHKQKLLGHVEGMQRAAEALAHRWRDASSRAGRVDVFADMTSLTLQVVTETLLGSRESEDMHALASATSFFQRYANGALTRVVPVPLWVPTPLHRDHARALAALDRVTYRLIDEKRASGARGTDVLSILVDAKYDDGRPLSRKQIRDEVLTLLTAGHDTTANLLSWTFHLLGHHPWAVTRMREELRKVVGDRRITSDDLPNLRFMRGVLDESLRLYPPAWTTARLARESIKLDSGYIEPGDIVLVSPWVVHRRPELFPNPEAFVPERWHDASALPPFAFFPFGGGAHKCIGDQFSIQEAMIVLAALVPAFDVTPIPGHHVEPEPLITLTPKRGLPMHVRAVTCETTVGASA